MNLTYLHTAHGQIVCVVFVARSPRSRRPAQGSAQLGSDRSHRAAVRHSRGLPHADPTPRHGRRRRGRNPSSAVPRRRPCPGRRPAGGSSPIGQRSAASSAPCSRNNTTSGPSCAVTSARTSRTKRGSDSSKTPTQRRGRDATQACPASGRASQAVTRRWNPPVLPAAWNRSYAESMPDLRGRAAVPSGTADGVEGDRCEPSEHVQPSGLRGGGRSSQR